MELNTLHGRLDDLQSGIDGVQANLDAVVKLPAFTAPDIGKVLTIIDDGDGNPILSWETPA